MSEIWGIPPTYRRPQNHLFSTTSQLNDSFNGLYLRNKTQNRQSGKYARDYKRFTTSSQNVMNFGPQTAYSWTVVLPTLRKFCILLHCQDSQMGISKRNSTKLCQTVDNQLR